MAVSNRGAAAIAAVSALTAAVITVGAFRKSGPGAAPETERVLRVHEMGGMVMPFSLEGTTHVFEMTDSGGIQDVVAKEPGDTATIRLVRQHLLHEADLFRRGDFRDPLLLHGADMPGVQALSAGSERVTVRYQELGDGARITFTTRDRSLLTAIHRWFGAQLSDHAVDATYR